MRKFSDIIGQKAIIEHLYNALRTGSISHAYILKYFPCLYSERRRGLGAQDDRVDFCGRASV